MAKLIPGENDLATLFPEIAAEWHPTKNGELSPNDVQMDQIKKFGGSAKIIRNILGRVESMGGH